MTDTSFLHYRFRIHYGIKTFDIWGLYNKTNYGRNCPGKPFQPSLVLRYKQSSLLQKPQITAVISLMIQAPGGKKNLIYIKHHLISSTLHKIRHQ
jgi:hypothetical protein